jgi:hypothetical protein
VSTPAVYAAWDRLGGPSSSPSAGGVNDLEPAALAVEPRLAEWRDRLGEATGLTPALAGSGGTWFVEGEFPAVPGPAPAARRLVLARTRNGRPLRDGRSADLGLLARPPLPARRLQHLLVLLLAHALAALLDQ